MMGYPASVLADDRSRRGDLAGLAASLAEDLERLTSPEAGGRLSGTAGARYAARYLAGQLAAAGFAPALQRGPEPDGGLGGYLQPVEVSAARLRGPVRLRVGERELRHRQDFGELPVLSAGGRVTGPLLVVRDGEAVDPGRVRGSIVLIAERPTGFDIGATAAAAAELGAGALLVAWGEPRWFHKTVYSGQGALPVLRLRDSVARELARLGGAQVEVDLPLEAGVRTCQNVVGILPGANRERTLLLTAHYDHVGDDPDGERFPGAEDNASGVAAILTAARWLAQRGPLPFNLLVAFLTGEESGLWGARQLTSHRPLPINAVINLDGVGGEPTLAAMRLGHAQAGDWPADLAAEVLEGRGIAAQWITGQDDSSAFIRAGLPTVGLGQQPVAGGGGRMHMPDDDLSHLSLASVLDAATVVTAIVERIVLAPHLLASSQSERRPDYV